MTTKSITISVTPSCSIAGCPNSLRDKIKSTVFYYMPKNPLRAKKWDDAIKDQLLPNIAKVLICREHFTTNDFEDNSHKLKQTAVPSIFDNKDDENPAKKMKIDLNTQSNVATDSPLNSLVLNSPDTRVFVLEANMFSNIASKPEPPKKYEKKVYPLPTKSHQPKNTDVTKPSTSISNKPVIPQAKKDTTNTNNEDISDVETERKLKEQIELAKAQRKKLLEELQEVTQEDLKLNIEITQLEKELKERKLKLKNFSVEEEAILKKCFSPAQILNLQGNKKSHWTLDDLAMGYNITCMTSTNFYKYLRDEFKFPLPSVSNITRCVKEFSDEPEKLDKINENN